MAWPGHGGWQPAFIQTDPRFPYPPFAQPPISPPAHWFAPETGFPPQQPLQSPLGIATHVRSNKYPKLNPALAEDTTLIRFDIKQRPSKSIIPQAYQPTRIEFAMAQPTKHIRLISKAFPWSIDIVSEANITCEDVWRALWNSMQQNLADSEWGLLVRQDGMFDRIDASVKKRLAADPKAEKNPKRIDILGDMTIFRGLEQDPAFAKLRMLPFSKPCSETWVVRLSD